MARHVLSELVADTPARTASVQVWLSVCLDPNRATPKPADLLAACVEVGRWLPGIETELAGCGVAVLGRATLTWLTGAVRAAFDPAARPHLAAAGLEWADAGPVAALEDWDHYRHESGVSVTWALREAPRQAVDAGVLAPLLAPGPFPRRVTWLYQPYPADQAAAKVEAEVTAGQIRRAWAARTRRDETQRDRDDRDRALQSAREEAAGAGVGRFTLYVTTTVTDDPSCPPRSPTSNNAPARPSCGCAACAEPKPPGSPPPSASVSTPTTCSPSAGHDDPRFDHPRDAGLARRRRWPGGERGRGHPLRRHHQPAVRAVPLRGGLGRHPARGAVRPHLHTAEPVGLDPAHWLRTGLVSNTGVWVQGQPGIGKSSITKRLLVGLVGFGMRAVIPGDVKGEYTPLITALGGTVWRIGRGHHALNPLDAGLAAPALAAAVGTAAPADRREPARPPPVPARGLVGHHQRTCLSAPNAGCSPPRSTRPPPPGSSRSSPTSSTC